ncbi:hypothetical protein SEA_MAVERICK_56 [Mycobacterium phage Maverick]|uniref:Uncharacterized protein n=1 Tax=Mycobacterium phage Maverick TaxID=1701799 RepID=A0A0M4S4V1_9CAUD|nr:hypothetical protein SEA_MAVERICK_56 [Mycobacterium phage Maverick]
MSVPVPRRGGSLGCRLVRAPGVQLPGLRGEGRRARADQEARGGELCRG